MEKTGNGKRKTENEKRKSQNGKRSPSEPFPPPPPIGRVLLSMLRRGDARVLIEAEYARELAAFLSAEERSLRHFERPIHKIIACADERREFF